MTSFYGFNGREADIGQTYRELPSEPSPPQAAK